MGPQTYMPTFPASRGWKSTRACALESYSRIATALVEAYKTVGFTVPLVVRLEGTEVKEGRQIIADSGADIITAEGLTDAAKKVVAAAG